MNRSGPRSPYASLVLIVGPDESFGILLKHFLERLGYCAKVIGDARCALRLLGVLGAQLVITTLEGTEPDGMELLVGLAAERNRPKLLVCSEHPSASTTMIGASGIKEDGRVLPRPSRLDAIATAVQDLLAATDGEAELAM
jgi:DNA-binding response OmpR family regulator